MTYWTDKESSTGSYKTIRDESSILLQMDKSPPVSLTSGAIVSYFWTLRKKMRRMTGCNELFWKVIVVEWYWC